MAQTIFTLDARDNVFLEVMSGHFNLSQEDIYREIQNSFEGLLSTLDRKKINYQDLKNALIPRNDRKEIAFVFDTTLIDSSSYGYEVFENLIKIFDVNSTNSILCGDFIGKEQNKEHFKTLFHNNIKAHKLFNYVHHSLFYIVYINNLSESLFLQLDKGLKKFNGYTGYFDLNYSSQLKTILSTMLVRAFLKNRKSIINATEGSEDVNMTGYPFEENGFRVVGVDDLQYGMFLSYKIEREIIWGFESDTSFSLNAISKNVLNIYEFELMIEDKKLEYLLKEKGDNLERAGMMNLSVGELEALIRNKIANNYIYNLTYLPEHGTLKFNIMIEVLRSDNRPMKMIVSLEYKAQEEKLRLITMF